jgi:hypothetical protein
MAQHPPSDTETAAPGLRSAVLMLAALAALGLATLVDLVDGPGDARQERVAATPALPVDLAALRRFPGAARHYVAKRYALKDGFVALNAAVKLGAFGHSPYPDVMGGKDGFLFLGRAASIEAAQGVPAPVPSSDAAWTAHFSATAAAFKARGIPYVFILGPDKIGVQSDALPDWLATTLPPIPRATRILAASGAGSVDVGALFRQMRARDSGLRLYHRTDTHWTEAGAALAVDAALAPLGLTGPTTPTTEVSGPAGDLARMIGWQDRLRETAPVLPRPPGLRCETPDGAAAQILTLDPLPMVRFRCTNADGAPLRALVFMDSFGMGAAPRLTQMFGDVTFVWQDRIDMGLVDDLQPDVTIRIMVERKLQTADPATLLRAPVP